MYVNMIAFAGQTGDQLPRENFVTRRFTLLDKASLSMARHCAPLFLCAAAACFIVQRSGLSGVGHFRCGAEFLSHTDRKSTRLNSSHSSISYAVFCLKKKKKKK